MKRYIPTPEIARAFGFEWSSDGWACKDFPSRLVVTRSATISTKKGIAKTRIVTIYAERGQLNVYISPTGRIKAYAQK